MMEPRYGTQPPTPQRTGKESGELEQHASELTRTAGERAVSTLDEQKHQICDLLDRLAHTAEDDRFGRYVADYARRGTQFLRQRSARDILSSLRSQLKSRPEVTLSAFFVAGLALARFMKRDRGSEYDRGFEFRGTHGERGFSEPDLPELGRPSEGGLSHEGPSTEGRR